MSIVSDRLPNLIIIGAQKCGTTSLHHYLGVHPEIQMSREKELKFFCTNFNWSKGVDWYASHFSPEAKIRGESSPHYTYGPFLKGVPERMSALIPSAKLIYLVRPPIDRIVAHYVHRVADGREERPFEEVVLEDGQPFISLSRYYANIQEYLRYFPRRQILVVSQQDLLNHRRETLSSIFRYLEVDEQFYSRRFSYERHKTSQKRRKTRLGRAVGRRFGDKLQERLPPELRHKFERVFYLPMSRPVEPPKLSATIRRKLSDVLRDDFRQFEQFAGRGFPGWIG